MTDPGAQADGRSAGAGETERHMSISRREPRAHAIGAGDPRGPVGQAKPSGTRLALALGGGAARGLAHIGVLEVLEREGIRPDCIVGSSMGGLIGALAATGLASRDIAEVARGFAFPRWYLPGGTIGWDAIFPTAAPILSPLTFERLVTPLVVTAVDLESGTEVILHAGRVLPAVRATCAVPGVLAPVKLAGRWLIDGGLVNILPGGCRMDGRAGRGARGQGRRAAGATDAPARLAHDLSAVPPRQPVPQSGHREALLRGARPGCRDRPRPTDRSGRRHDRS